ncbi:nucleotidyltransferase family protein [Bradyrhizobium manausense]|uniref:Nucleotidyltransferase n=1 Tax=Bradyrhizobium manausense TaxID=989370 RepID=A0A0R3E5N2_9BRAD|nr:nucleotidyltransferase family protein [Bradyrhizobium manausense]KRQ15348.1 hypothetical protein AOQ71_10130 [Bradyrhizobium manausense]
MVQLTPEETLLLLSCRVTLTKAEDAHFAAVVNSSLDWPFVLWRAETYQTVPLMAFHLQRMKLLNAIPSFIAEYIHNWSSLSQARSREQFRELGRLVNALKKIEVDYFLLKGVALANTVYPDPLLRPMQDIDIMIQPRDAWRVQREAYRLGYKHGVFNPRDGRFTPLFRKITWRSLREKHALHSLTKTTRVPSPVPAKLIPLAWQKRQIKSYSSDDGAVAIPIFVDFHVNLFPEMSLSDVWRGAGERTLLGQSVKVQSPTGMLWFSAARLYQEAFQHGTLKLQMFGDVDGLLTTCKEKLNWAELLAIAKKYHIAPSLYYVLSQAQRLGSGSVPDAVLTLLKPDQQRQPDQGDWGDVVPKLLSRPIVNEFEYAKT